MTCFCVAFYALTVPCFSQPAKIESALHAPFRSKIDEPYLRQGFRCIGRQAWDEAAQQFDHCKQLDLLNITQLTKVVWTYTDAGEHVKALPLAVLLVERVKSSKEPLTDDQKADAYQCRVVCYEATREWAKAAEDYQILIRLRPSKAFHWSDSAGRCYLRLGKLAQASAMFDNAMALQKNDPVLMFHKAQCLDAQSRWSEAIVILNASVNLCMAERRKMPDAHSQFYADLLKERVRCNTKLGQYAKANSDKRTLTELDSAWADSLFGGK